MHQLEDVVRHIPGIRDIEEIDYDHREKEHLDDWKSTFVCRINGIPYLVEFAWHTNCLNYKSNSLGVVKQTLIDEVSYARYASESLGSYDADKMRAHIAYKDALKNELDALTPKCPKCGKLMEQRTNRRTGEPFWGCSGFVRADCNGTRSMSVTFKARLAAYHKLSQ